MTTSLQRDVVNALMSEPIKLIPVPRPYHINSFDNDKHYIMYQDGWLFGKVHYNSYTKKFDMHTRWATTYSQIDDCVAKSIHEIYEITLPVFK